MLVDGSDGPLVGDRNVQCCFQRDEVVFDSAVINFARKLSAPTCMYTTECFDGRPLRAAGSERKKKKITRTNAPTDRPERCFLINFIQVCPRTRVGGLTWVRENEITDGKRRRVSVNEFEKKKKPAETNTTSRRVVRQTAVADTHTLTGTGARNVRPTTSQWTWYSSGRCRVRRGAKNATSRTGPHSANRRAPRAPIPRRRVPRPLASAIVTRARVGLSIRPTAAARRAAAADGPARATRRRSFRRRRRRYYYRYYRNRPSLTRSLSHALSCSLRPPSTPPPPRPVALGENGGGGGRALGGSVAAAVRAGRFFPTARSPRAPPRRHGKPDLPPERAHYSWRRRLPSRPDETPFTSAPRPPPPPYYFVRVRPAAAQRYYVTVSRAQYHTARCNISNIVVPMQWVSFHSGQM